MAHLAHGSASGASGPSGSGASGAESTPSQDAIARLASMENVIYGQVNAARKKELRDQKEKAKLTNMVNKLSAELAEARKPKDPVSLIKKVHMLTSGEMKKNKTKTPISEELREAADGALDPEDAVQLQAIALKLEGGASGESGAESGASGAEDEASGASGPSPQEELGGIVAKLKAMPGEETKQIAKLAAKLGTVLASPSGSEMLGPDAQKKDRDPGMGKEDLNGLKSIAGKLANLLNPSQSGSSGSSGASGSSGSSGASGAEEDPLADVIPGQESGSSGASGAEDDDQDDGVDAAKDELLEKRVKKLEAQLEAIGGDSSEDKEKKDSKKDSSSDDDSSSGEDGEEKKVEADEKKEEEKKDGATLKDKKEEEEEKKDGETAGEKKKPVTGKGKAKNGFKKVEQVQKGDLDNMINSPNPTFKHPDPDAEKQKLKIPKDGSQEAPSIVKNLASKPTSGTHVVTTNK